MIRTPARLAASICCLVIAFATGALAAELRIVDGAGLVRAIKVVRTNAKVIIRFEQSGAPLRGECVATNVDGLAQEKRTSVSPQGECVFNDVSVGSWQVVAPKGAAWRAQIYE